MALPPNEIGSFEREVDENYRRDRAADFARTYGKWIAIGVIAILAVVAAFLFWQNQQAQKAGEQVEELAKVMTDFVDGERVGLDERLQAVASDSDGATKAAALMTEAALAMDAGDRTKATEIYRAVAADGDLPQPFRDVAVIRDVQLTFDTAEPADIIAKLQPLAQPGKPFYGSAGELTAAAMLKMGREQEAGQIFAQLANDSVVPQTIQTRAAQMASSLGVETPATVTDQEEE
ncbi:tetratricopeptide repeat protein [Sphingomicrobium clamense]|uniref:Tetratricopeptide repeat protein n=1 Tax=Sphingomicrobium clamense TaxID=2851013 RepID=A0ABS6V4B1_9SPHN|nr:tetratricopeptide repeat protein [Sphingomicrobium sp. B8]MBW0144379.1 tetratricopeptide repeat protein [Sphingomicrobium sp. B8]